MKYNEYEKEYIGSSDIATLILAGCEKSGKIKTETLKFTKDGSYDAYITDEKAEIDKHYEEKNNFFHWLKIYDDQGKTKTIYGKEIKIYRAGNFGCIIQIIE